MSDPVRDRKFRRVRISLTALAHVLVHPDLRIMPELPEDAVYVKSWIDTDRDFLNIVFAHDSFHQTGETEEVAMLKSPTFTRSDLK